MKFALRRPRIESSDLLACHVMAASDDDRF
jgi:hypothetical protein